MMQHTLPMATILQTHSTILQTAKIVSSMTSEINIFQVCSLFSFLFYNIFDVNSSPLSVMLKKVGLVGSYAICRAKPQQPEAHLPEQGHRMHF